MVVPAGAGVRVPEELFAHAPPETRGVARDQVRLLVASPDGMVHTRFHALVDHLAPGDLLVVNTSATVASAVDGVRAGGVATTLHVAPPVPGGGRVVEPRRPDGRGPQLDAVPGEHVAAAGADVELTERFGRGARLWRARITAPGGVDAWLAGHARPITYGGTGRWPLAMYQTVFAQTPGSAEMPSASRPFTAELVTRLVTRGVQVAPLLLHTGLSSLEDGEPPLPEYVEVPAATARVVNDTRRAGGRVIAAGTTVVRALESASAAGYVHAVADWTELVLSPARPVRVVDGLITGWHEPGASHLQLLAAVAGDVLVATANNEALAQGYLWHEFGDSCLLLR